jgi:PAS domain S-box-containing protein
MAERESNVPASSEHRDTSILPLYNLTTELVRLHDVGAISEAALVAASLMFNVAAAALWLADDERQTLHLLGHRGADLHPWPETLPLDADYLLVQVFHTQQALYIPDADAAHGIFQGGPQMHTQLAAPLVAGGRSLGMLYLERAEVAPFSDSERMLIDTLANTVAIVLENALLFEAADQAQTRYRAVSELTSDYAYAIRVEPDGRFVYEWVTEPFSRVVGITLEEMNTGDTWLEFIHPEDRPAWRRRAQVLRAGRPDVSDFRIITKGGETRFLRDHGRPEWDWEQSRVVRIYGAAQDITERKRAQEKIERLNEQLFEAVQQELAERRRTQEALGKAHDELEQRVHERTFELSRANQVLRKEIDERKRVEGELRKLSRAVEQSPSLIMITDTSGNIEYVNPKFAQVTGYTLEEVVGQNPRILKSGETPSEEYKRLWSTILSGGEWRGEFHNKKRNGELYWESASISPITDAEGQVTHFIAVTEDITERKRADEALRQHAARLKTLTDIDRAILAARSPEEIAQAALSHIQQLVPCQRASVVTFDLAAQQVVLLAVYVDGETRLGAGERTPLEPSELTELMQHKVHSIEDIMALPNRASTYRVLHAREMRSYLTVSLVSQSELIGCLNMGSDIPCAFTPEHISIAREVADHLAVAIQNARLYEAEQHARWTAEILRAANLALTQTLDLDTVLETLLDYLGRLVPYDTANIMLLEGDSHVTVQAVRGDEQWGGAETVHSHTFEVQDYPSIERLVTTQQSILIADTQQQADWEFRVGMEYVRNWLGVPLVAGGNVIGLYSLNKASPGFFTEEHVQLAEALAAQAAVAVQNAELFEQVRTGRERLQALSRRLVEVQETERRHISRELHDEVGQALTTLMVGLRLVERETQLSEKAASRVADLKHMTDGVLENLHRLAMDLRPASLDHLGLVAALRQYIESFSRQNDLMVEFASVGLDGERLPATVETALYRIVQEALTNVARHAQATSVDVLLERRGGQVITVVEDNGVGFDPKEAARSGRLGLFGMQERVEMLGGTLLVESSIGAGTTVVAEVPYAHSNSDR